MAIGGVEWVVVGIIAVVMLIWGPEKIPQLARMIGRARREFEEAQKELNNPVDQLLQSVGTGAEPPSTTDDELLDKAHRLGIVTKGRTREEVSAEVAKTSPTPPPSVNPSAAAGQSSDDEKLFAAARQLGISIDGKTKDQVKEEIVRAVT